MFTIYEHKTEFFYYKSKKVTLYYEGNSRYGDAPMKVTAKICSSSGILEYLFKMGNFQFRWKTFTEAKINSIKQAKQVIDNIQQADL